MIRELNFTESDNQTLNKIKFNKDKIKNLNYDYKNVLVTKPWGNEYLFYSTKKLSIWILRILKNKKTSLHCHTNKKTSLIILDGKAKLNNLSESVVLNSGDCSIIDKKVFHRTSAEFDEDLLVMEIETPTNKNDIVRLKDEYDRSNSGYETEKSYVNIEKNNFLEYSKIADSRPLLGLFYLNKFENFKSIDALHDEALFCPIELKNLSLENKIELGGVYSKKFIEENQEELININKSLVIQKK